MMPDSALKFSRFNAISMAKQTGRENAMNAGNIVNMVVRLVMRQVIGRGINKGIEVVGDRMNKGKSAEEQGQPPESGKTKQRMRQSVRMARRFGRF